MTANLDHKRSLQATPNQNDPAVVAMTARMIASRPLLFGRWLAIGESLLSCGQLSLGRQALLLFREQTDDTSMSRFACAKALARARLYDEAWALTQSVSSMSDSDEYAELKGTIAMNLGRFDLAKEALGRACDLNPSSGKAWLKLSMLAGSDARDIYDRLHEASEAIAASAPKEQVRYHYARGALLDAQGRWADAFAAFETAAWLAYKFDPYDFDADLRGFEEALAGSERAAIDRIGQTVGATEVSPIVVTGLPRSGTTLVEQILASHSKVSGGDELNYFEPVFAQIGGKSISRLAAWLKRGGDGNSLARSYLTLCEQRFGDCANIVDKTLEASRYLGLIAGLLPNAPIIWLRRDPLDCAWSNFRTYVGAGANWSSDLTAMARHFRLEDRLFDRWTDILGERILTVDYEGLVQNPVEEIRKILDHCHLQMEPAVLRPELNTRPVSTMSVAQVRRPIARASIGPSETYSKLLQPFIAAYES